MNKDNRTSMLKKIYGQNIGLVQNSKPIMIENPEFLKLTQNGNDSDAMETESAPRVNGNSKLLTPSFPKRGPTDKQLEMMTSDGRRRITPIFILPDAENTVNTTAINGNSCESFGKNQMQSSSSGAKSNIVIEKLDGIVEPNVSPGKKSGSPVSDNSASQLSSSPAPKTNMIAIKHKPGPINNTNPAINSSSTKVNGTAASVTASDSSDSQARAPPVNMIQVKKAPGKPPVEPPAKKAEEPVSSSGQQQQQQQVKKKINRIDSSSSDSDSSDSDSSSSSSDDETTSQTSKSGADTDRAGQESSKAKPKPEKPAVKPPAILNNKRKLEDSGSAGPAKKRGRPPGSVSGTSTPVKTPATAPATATPTTPAVTQTVSAAAKVTPSANSGGNLSLAASLSVPGLPPLSLNNNRQNVNYSQHRIGSSSLLNIFVQNDFHRTSLGSLHKVSSHEGPSLESPLVWDLMLPAPVTAVLSSPQHLLLTCRDATLHLLHSTGARALPPAVFPAPPHRLTVWPCGQRLVCVTTAARLFLWDLTLTPRVILKNEDIGPLSRINKRVSITITKITFNSEKLPILSLR